MILSDIHNQDYAFGVCRIEPENNIHLILESFEEKNSLPLIMVGNWAHGKYGINLKQRYSSCENICLLDPIYEQDKLNCLRQNCLVYLHGHSCGGTNPSLVEAMYLGLSIIAFDVSFNRETTNNQAFYFKTVEDLREITNKTDRDIFKKNGAIMQEIAKKRYTWSRIANLYAELF